MKRRVFLGGAAGVALASWPAWLARAFDPDATCESGDRIEALFDGYRAARRAGKPLLVLIIPEADADKWERGAQFGRVLNHGDRETMAALSLVTLSCATHADLARLVEVEDGAEEPLFVTVDTATRPAQVRAYRPELAQVSLRSGPGEHDHAAWTEAVTRAVDRQIEQLGSALRGAVVEVLPAAAQAVTEFSAERIARAVLAGEEIDSAEVLRVALALYRRAQASGPERDKLIAALSAAVRAEVVGRPVSGSVWGNNDGCGTSIEGRQPAEAFGYACGMAHVPAKSARFLYFYARMPWEG